MARIRTVKPELFRHEGLFELERDTGLPVRIAFIGLFTAADRDGCFKWRPRELQLDVMPYEQIDFSRVLDALGTRGFLVKYRVDDAWFGLIPTFRKHQVINNRERASELPTIDDCDEIFNFNNNDLPTREQRVIVASPTRHGNVQGEGKGREGKGTGKGSTRDALSDEQFEVFWKLYPKKASKKDALKAWKKIDAELFGHIIDSLGAHRACEQWVKDGGKFIPHAASWLNGEKFNDEVKPYVASTNGQRSGTGRPSLIDQVRQRGRELEAERGGQEGFGFTQDAELPPAWLETGGIDWDGEFARVNDSDGSIVGTDD